MRYIPKENQNIETSIFAPHVAHLRFITDFLTSVEKMKLDIELQKTILLNMSNLLARDYMANNDLENRSKALGVLGTEIHDMIMTIVNYQICFCDQVGGDALKLNECYGVLDDLSKKLY
ncbi:MAG: hypothetical protein WCQ00_01640 [bacterium]